ncbi:hypothetical protein [Amycolatopsis sp. WGS_07]|uniref:hypothetical protein n=1 Tax=Amycolatopsis sp. WGS_07 TaxID=3076764 RepID=UPI003872B196
MAALGIPHLNGSGRAPATELRWRTSIRLVADTRDNILVVRSTAALDKIVLARHAPWPEAPTMATGQAELDAARPKPPPFSPLQALDTAFGSRENAIVMNANFLAQDHGSNDAEQH